ncbi:MAG TPA: hypothetical protein PKE38_15870, partial [Ignavibacteriaceae bacterium]|nr:hypothetical protein [Ignavibacteriaceae bacterium]
SYSTNLISLKTISDLVCGFPVNYLDENTLKGLSEILNDWVKVLEKEGSENLASMKARYSKVS